MPFLLATRNKLQVTRKKNNVSRVTSYLSPAFTLIELLVVIAVIGILATLAVASFGGVQARARDAQRKNDLDAVKKTLELVKNDCQGNSYPWLGGSAITGYTNLGNYLTDPDLKYLSSMPTDPKNTDPYQYAYWTSGNNFDNACPSPAGDGTFTVTGQSLFTLWARLERTTDPDAANSRRKCAARSGSWPQPHDNIYAVCDD